MTRPDRLPDGAWRLVGDGLAVEVEELGARVRSVRVDGVELTTAFTGEFRYDGHTVGRYANRIAESRFRIDGVEVDVVSNQGRHQLHGGPGGFHTLRWEGEPGTDRLVLRTTSPDGDQGFPGRVDAALEVEVVGRSIVTTWRATTTKVTPINLAPHIYWNLGSGGPLDGHTLQIAADTRVDVDPDGIPLPGPPRPVAGTKADFRSPRSLAGITFDHTWLFEADAPSPQVVVAGHGRTLTISTDRPGAQFYIGADPDRDEWGLAIEPQLPPDSPNRPDLGDPFVRPGETFEAATTWTVDW